MGNKHNWKAIPNNTNTIFTKKQSYISSKTSTLYQALKLGTPIKGLDIYVDSEAPVALERSEYPEWVNELSKPMMSLNKLRKIKDEDATLTQMKRFFKLSRKEICKEKNSEKAAARGK